MKTSAAAPRRLLAAVTGLALVATVLVTSMAGARAGGSLRQLVGSHLGNASRLSPGLRDWLAGPPNTAAQPTASTTPPSFGGNVDANDPTKDTLAGQSETAIAAQTGSRHNSVVLAAWNDASAFTGSPVTAQGSLTGVGISGDGAAHFHDLIGLPNNNVDEQWSGDPSVASLGDGTHFAVASLYYPSANACFDGLPAYGTVAVTIATANATGTGATFSAPVPVTLPGNLCVLFTGGKLPPNLGVLDKDWIDYDASSRTLAVSYTRLFFPNSKHAGNGQIEVIRAKVPASPTTLSPASFGKPVVIWRDEPFCPTGTPSSEIARCGAENEGAYVAVAPGGAAYVSWERNWFTNLFDGDTAVYMHAAVVPAGASAPSLGGAAHPVVVSLGQPNGNVDGGVKSLDQVPIAGYSRGQGNDFPRVAIDTAAGKVLFEWNDASLHPLGDIWLRPAALGTLALGTTARVNDDADFTLHFMPAVSVEAGGTVCSSWYDRRLGGASSTVTDYFADCRPTPSQNSTDFRVTTGSTDWAGTSSFINPNFGDYTDNATDGTRMFFTWSDGRVGVPQPFVASH